MKKVYKLEQGINNRIKVGDNVTIRDYSYLTKVIDNTDVYGLNVTKPVAKVIETGIKDVVYVSNNYAIVQDVIIEIQGVMYRSVSQFLDVKRTPEEVVKNRLNEAISDLNEARDNEVDLHTLGLFEDRVEFLADLINEIKDSK